MAGQPDLAALLGPDPGPDAQRLGVLTGPALCPSQISQVGLVDWLGCILQPTARRRRVAA